ncbi:uncharacterized protein J3D65DRAFT_695887 [Phyllosticta citribraziliensis]|uniref:Uncharacterized protein n=1 Tax=Phyllosticta citribraziliensis TaxID=989973 RepID=A0ABR1LP68_9PEZI
MALLSFLPLLFHTLQALAACDVRSAASPAHHHQVSNSTTTISTTPSQRHSSQPSTSPSTPPSDAQPAAARQQFAGYACFSGNDYARDGGCGGQSRDGFGSGAGGRKGLCRHDRRAVRPVRGERGYFDALVLPDLSGLSCHSVPVSLDDFLGRRIPPQCDLTAFQSLLRLSTALASWTAWLLKELVNGFIDDLRQAPEIAEKQVMDQKSLFWTLVSGLAYVWGFVFITVTFFSALPLLVILYGPRQQGLARGRHY